MLAYAGSNQGSQNEAHEFAFAMWSTVDVSIDPTRMSESGNGVQCVSCFLSVTPITLGAGQTSGHRQGELG
jgi:hypothetical protein